MKGSLVVLAALSLSAAVAKGSDIPKKSTALYTPEQIRLARQRLANEPSVRQAVDDYLFRAGAYRADDEMFRARAGN